MVVLRRFIIMFKFLTSIPFPVNVECTEEDCGKGLVFAPLVGLILGLIMWAVYIVLKSLLPLNILSALIILIYMILTGGLHLDGLGDTFDGLFSNRPKERILEIMRDSRVGTNAVLALICVVLLNYAVLSSLNTSSITYALLMFPVAGRIGLVIAAGISGYARDNQGLGKSFIEHCGIKEMVVGSILFFIVFGVILGIKGLMLAAVMSGVSIIVTKYFTLKINGATGDILGALCEVNQTVFLILFFVINVGTYR